MAINQNSKYLKTKVDFTIEVLIDFLVSIYERGYNDAKAILECGPAPDRMRMELLERFISQAIEEEKKEKSNGN